MPQILANLDTLPPEWVGAVAAIGNFDGVHQGHRAVLARALDLAAGRPCLMVTFEPHPRSHFTPGRPLFRLTPAPLKAALARALGLDGTVVMRFDTALAALPAEAFVRRILVERLGIAEAVIGFDFRYGHLRAGDAATLKAEGDRHGFGVTVVAAHHAEAGAVSSTRIRNALGDGDIQGANRLLGWSWGPLAPIIHGDKRGRLLGFPTANMALPPETRLAHGIYAVRLTLDDGARHDGVASFGRRPTFDDGGPRFETFLSDFAGDIYGRTVRVAIVERLRGELRFESAEALVAQMDRDVEAARRILSESPPRPLDVTIDRVLPQALAEAAGLG